MGQQEGPFETFAERSGGTTSEDVRTHAQTLTTAGTELGTVASDLRGRILSAALQTEGLLAVLLQEPSPEVEQSLELGGAAVFPAVLLRRWATAIDTFDSGVGDLNRRYQDAIGPDADQAARRAAEDDLRPSYDSLVRTLEDEGDTVAATLREGPDTDTLEQMLESRELQPGLLGLFPGIEVDDEVRELAQARALMDQLVAEGRLDGPVAEDSLYFRWLLNAQRQDVDADTIREVIDEHDIDPEDFEILDGLEEVQDRDGKSFFILPTDISGDDARRAVLMTYIFNAGTDYGDADEGSSTDNDFPETPFSSDEISRIADRQGENDWFSYGQDVSFVHGNGGRLATTPNGILMGLGGNWVQDIYSQRGGTTYGDIFMMNIDDPEDAHDMLRQVIESGVKPGSDGPGSPTNLDLDRLLHHEERHSQQWAEEGYAGFLASYAWEQLTRGNHTEEDAGLADGGYE